MRLPEGLLIVFDMEFWVLRFVRSSWIDMRCMRRDGETGVARGCQRGLFWIWNGCDVDVPADVVGVEGCELAV